MLYLVSMATLAAMARAQTDWQPLFGVTEPRVGHAMAPDPLTGRTMVFGGKDNNTLWAATALWDGTRWTHRNPSVEPSPRYHPAMAADFPRSRVLLFGGKSAVGFENDTWEWDGSVWQQRFPTNSPAPRYRAAMCGDLVRGRMVLFGGTTVTGVFSNGTTYDETWEWDGANWTQRTPTLTPGFRAGHGLCYDPIHNRTVLFGGTLATVTDTTWLWDGTTWTNANPPLAPSARSDFGMTFDFASNRVLVFGGQLPSGTPTASDLWAWDGAQWSNVPRTAAIEPVGWRECALCYDFASGRTVQHGGGYTVNYAETYEWDGHEWITKSPRDYSGAALALDPASGDGILFGGTAVMPQMGSSLTSDTWAWRAGAWQRLTPASQPPVRFGAHLAFDAARGLFVMFGGAQGVISSVPWSSVPLADTWLFDGVTWTAVPVATPPTGRGGGAIAYDSIRQEVVLFGGMGASAVDLQDTWTWNGATWTARSPAHRPSPRSGCGFAFDSVRGRCVLVGGSNFPPDLTWEWDGTDWTARPSQNTPPLLNSVSSFAFDPARRRCVLNRVILGSSEVWEWDGVDWGLRAPSGPLPRFPGVAAFDASLGRTLMVVQTGGGEQTWSYGPTHAATVAAFGSGCAGSVGIASLRPVDGSLPWLGETLRLAATPVPAGAPALLVLGLSDTTFGGQPLPLPLDTMGMTGCLLLTSIDQDRLAVAQGVRVEFPLALSVTPSLLGLRFFAQAAIFDPPADPAGIVASDAVACRIGGI